MLVHGQSQAEVRRRQRRHPAAAGFCAQVVADNLGAPATWRGAQRRPLRGAADSGGRGQPETGGGAVALRDANGDGRFEVVERFGTGSTTGIGIRNGYLYLAHPLTVERMKMTDGQLKPTGAAETMASGFPADRQHQDKGLAFDGTARSTSTSARPRTLARAPTGGPASKARIPARCWPSTPESGSSTRTSWDRRRTWARGSPPACAR